MPQAIAPDNREAYRRAVAAVRLALERAVTLTVAVDASFADRERAVLAAANEACRLMLETALHATAETQADRVRVEGVVYERHHEGTVAYHSLCGPLEVRRATYREVGVRNGPTIVPVELAAGLIEGATPALAFRVALGYAQGPGRQAEEQMHADHRQPPSRSTLERLGKAIGTQTHRVAPRIEAVVRQEERCPRGRTRSSSASIGPRSRWKNRGPRARRRSRAANPGRRRTAARHRRRWTSTIGWPMWGR